MFSQRKLNAIWLDFEKETAYHEGRNITSLYMKRKDGAWLLVVKADRKGQHDVCFTSAHTMTACLDAFLTMAQTRNLRWYKDRYK